MIDTRQNYIFHAHITCDFFNSIIFKTALEIAKENHYPCFFIIDNSSNLPDDWHNGLNIHYLKFYKTREQLLSLTTEMTNEIQNYHKIQTFNHSSIQQLNSEGPNESKKLYFICFCR
jgi:hypothetical protein